MNIQDEVKLSTLLYYPLIRETMHNLMSKNQLAEWKHSHDDNRCLNTPQDELIDDYFSCLIESEGYEQERLCRQLLC